MKCKKLLILGTVALLGGGAANATIVSGVRQAPVPTTSALQYSKTMYMYNVKAGKFFLGANDYGTRASIGDKGYKVQINKVAEGLTGWTENTVEIKDSVETQKAWKNAFIGDSVAVWVDNSTNANRFFEISAGAQTNTYRFRGAPQNAAFTPTKFPNCYMGLNDTITNNTRITGELNIIKVPNGGIDWAFVSEADYANYFTAINLFNEAAILKTYMDQATALNIDIATEKAVYLDEASTMTQIDDAIASVKAKMAAYDEQNTDAANPKDKTVLITNPSFASNNMTGWSGTSAAFQSYTDAEFYQKKFNFYQDLKSIPNGVYAMSLQAFYRAGYSDVSKKNYEAGTGKLATIYTKIGTDSLTSAIKNAFADAITTPLGMNESTVDGKTIPNNMETAEKYFTNGLYNNTVFFGTDDHTARIGLAKDSVISGDWVLFDNFTLKYYGNSAAAYQLWLDDVKKNAPSFAALPATTLTTKGTVDTYNSTVSGLSTAATRAEVVAAMKTINDAAAVVNANIAAWTAYQEAFTKGQKLATDASLVGTKKDELADYVDLDGADFMKNLTATTAEVETETAKLTTLIDEVVRTCITEGTDVTDKYLINANFETDGKGWTVKAATGGNVAYGGSKTNRCFEAWNNSSFDIYQVVKNAPVGVYEISVQGFYRYLRGNNALNAYAAGTITCPVNVYVNNSKSVFKNVFEEKVACKTLYTAGSALADADGTYWYPNDMNDGSIAFANNMYVSKSFGLVAKDGGELRIGVTGATNQGGDSWAIWDNFKMVYQGFKVDVIKPLLQTSLSTAESMKKQGTMGKSVLAQVTTAIEAANTAVAGTDGKAMLAALNGLLEVQDSVNASVALFKELQTQNEDLYSAVSTSTGSEDVKNSALALNSEITSKIDGGTLENADAQAYMTKIKEMISKLKLPDYSAASDNNPINVSVVLATPTFDKDGVNSVAGWENTTGYNFGNDDTQKAALLLEFYNKTFNMYQDIIGLPNGTYRVGVQAFYRFGSAADDATKYDADKATIGNAYMYATAGKDTLVSTLPLLASGAMATNTYAGTMTDITLGGTTMKVPNDMVSAGNYFTDGAYKDSVFIKVTDGKLRIGIAQKKNVANDWVIMDNWTLTYYGANSSKSETATTTGIEGITTGAATKVEFFNLNGVRTNAPSKGLNIMKITDENGKMTVRKVNVK